VTVQDTHWLHKLKGTFLVFEGPAGSGKSTQMRRLRTLLDQANIDVTEVREPGGTSVGEEIRTLLLHSRSQMTIRCEMLLYMASRAQLVDEKITPALQRGHVVLADRFVQSTLAYQGTAGGIDHADIRAVAQAALRGLAPDLVLIFDVDLAIASSRINPLLATSTRKEALDRIESRGDEFHRKVRDGYRAIAQTDQANTKLIDAGRTPDLVWRDVDFALRHFAADR
jgi:dTMP kinase